MSRDHISDQWVTWVGGWDSLTLNHKGYSKSNRTQEKIYIYIYIKNYGKLLLHIGQLFLLQIRVNSLTNWGSYYKLGPPLLQNRAAITNWGKNCHKLGQVLQIRAIITDWGITTYIHTYIQIQRLLDLALYLWISFRFTIPLICK